MQNFAADSSLLEKKSRILIAVSGGPDSVCLLHMLAFLRAKDPATLAIVHVNYQLRGKESQSDERFVEALAKKYGIPCFTKRYPKTSKKRDEESLRDFRYRFFSSLAQEHHFDLIALGHQKNDQAETFLMNLIRGCGPLGLASMSPKQGKYIRPLLDTSREEILRYLSTCQLAFRLDESNTDVRYTRNRIRHELIPLLAKRFNPNIVTTLARSASLFSESAITETAPVTSCPVSYQNNDATFSRRDFCALSHPAQKTLLRTLARALSREDYTPTQAVLEEFRKVIIATKTQSTTLTVGPLKCTRNHDRVFLLYLPS